MPVESAIVAVVFLERGATETPVGAFMSTRCKQLLRIGMCCAAAALAVNGIRLGVVRASIQLGPESPYTIVLKEPSSVGMGKRARLSLLISSVSQIGNACGARG